MIGFIGSGRVTRVIIGAWVSAGFNPGKILVFDKERIAADGLAKQFPNQVSSVANLDDLSSCTVLFLAVHPPVMLETLAAIKPFLQPGTLVVSLAPKISLSAMKTALGGHGQLARVNPSAAGIVGMGLNPYVLSADSSPQNAEIIMQLFSQLGATLPVEESKIEAYAVISAMGPTYFWFQMEQLCQLAVEFGMDQAEARKTTELMLLGAVQAMFHSGLTPEQVKDLVPVKPLGPHESTIKAMYQESLAAIYAKIQP